MSSACESRHYDQLKHSGTLFKTMLWVGVDECQTLKLVGCYAGPFCHGEEAQGFLPEASSKSEWKTGLGFFPSLVSPRWRLRRGDGAFSFFRRI